MISTLNDTNLVKVFSGCPTSSATDAADLPRELEVDVGVRDHVPGQRDDNAHLINEGEF